MTAPHLAGVRVADLSRVLAGPYCTMLLADLGADVVKVERPGTGDETRSWGPPYAGGESAYFLSVNRRKRSVALDLKDPDAHELALELCARSDVVIENFRPGGADSLGLGERDVRARNPGVVFCSITGFGPGDDRAGYDFIAQAESGVMAVTGDRDGRPTKVGFAVVDVLTGLNAANGIMAALLRRAQSGEGEHVQVALLDTALASLVNVAQNALVTDSEPVRYGNAHPSIVPYEPIEAADGWVAVAAANDGLFARLCTAAGAGELAVDARFRTNAERVCHRGELMATLARIFVTRTADEWVAVLAKAGVPVGKIRGVSEALRRSDALLTVDHPAAGRLELVQSPLRFAAAGEPPLTPPPLRGEHTAQVIAELGVSPDGIAALAARGAVELASPARP
jgi:crotonobetainyl-CoA:carnitine CoA-transferase CaiB-like acyl-CoA transferase